MRTRPIRILRKDKKGATAIEFAVIAFPFFLILMGIIEFGLTVFIDSSLNSGMRATARQGLATGYSNKTEIATILQNHMAGTYRDISSANSGLDIRLIVVDDVTDIPSNNPEVFFQTPQSTLPSLDSQRGKIVIYAAKYEWGGFTKLLSGLIPENLYAITVVKNEAF